MEEEQINVARAQSSIRDADYAKEASESIRASILGKASIRVLLIGAQQSKSVLSLLDA
jgi:flagellin